MLRSTILMFVFFVLLITSCGERDRSSSDVRLDVAEELLCEYPDSALALLRSIDVSSISTKSDYARYALLKVQAQWTSEGLVDNAALIDVALNFYQDNHDPGMMTRSLVYKGIVLDRAGNDTVAIDFYCKAQENSDTALVPTMDIEEHRNRCLSIVSQEMKKLKAKRERSERNEKLINIIIILLFIALLFKVMRMRLQAKQNLEHIKQLQLENNEAKVELLSRLEKETKLKGVLSAQIENIRELIDMSYRYSGSPATFMKRFQEKVKRTKLPDDFWKDLRFFIDNNYNNVITRLEQLHPSLSEDELYLIGLMCCGFSYTEIAICMGYSNVCSANTKRARITRKLGLEEPLKDYIERLMTMK